MLTTASSRVPILEYQCKQGSAEHSGELQSPLDGGQPGVAPKWIDERVAPNFYQAWVTELRREFERSKGFVNRSTLRMNLGLLKVPGIAANLAQSRERPGCGTVA